MAERQYLDLLHTVLTEGDFKGDRTGTGTYSVFGPQLTFDLREGYPLITTKKVFFRSLIHELIWFLSGSSNINYLIKSGVKIWNLWADEFGEVGPIYGPQWRNWPQVEIIKRPPNTIKLKDDDGAIEERGVYTRRINVDQIEYVINELLSNPDSRRIVVSTWNPHLLPSTELVPEDNASLGRQALAPCHVLFQFNTSSPRDDGNRYLDLKLYIRSNDLFLGAPFNIAQYCALLHMIAHVTGFIPRYYIHSIGDAHIYSNHVSQVRTQLTREPYPFPELVLNQEKTHLDGFTVGDFELKNYRHHDALPAPIAK